MKQAFESSVILIKNASKVYGSSFTSVKDWILNFLKYKQKPPGFKALDNISLTIEKGEVVGLIGPNGAGKSTLLKLIAGTTTASSGSLDIKGKVLAILNISTGLDEHMTGRQNIFHMATLYGYDRNAIQSFVEPIIEFTELGHFIDLPVRTYSMGMKARLAFSIVTSYDFDILLIDEALSVGDAGFVQKCRQRIRSLCQKGKTVIIVSHGMTSICELCNRVIWLEQGRIKMEGEPRIITEVYRASLIHQANEDVKRRYQYAKENRIASNELELKDFKLINSKNEVTQAISVGESGKFVLEMNSSNKRLVNCKLTLLRVDGVQVVEEFFPSKTLVQGKNKIEIVLKEMRLGRFLYEVNLSLTDVEAHELLLSTTLTMVVVDDFHSYNSSYYPKMEWQEIKCVTG